MKTVVLRTFDNYFSANILLTKLADAGVTCYLFDENTTTIGPIIGQAIGYIKLVVDEREEPAARNMLARFDEEYLRTVQCPKCAAHHIILVPKPGVQNYLAAIFTWFFSSYAVATEKVYQCQECGYESATLPLSVAENN